MVSSLGFHDPFGGGCNKGRILNSIPDFCMHPWLSKRFLLGHDIQFGIFVPDEMPSKMSFLDLGLPLSQTFAPLTLPKIRIVVNVEVELRIIR